MEQLVLWVESKHIISISIDNSVHTSININNNKYGKSDCLKQQKEHLLVTPQLQDIITNLHLYHKHHIHGISQLIRMEK